jgi:hypothetical protein
MKDHAAGARAKPMTATATTMVKSVWAAYFIASGQAAADEDAAAAGAAAQPAQEVEEDPNEEENDEEEAETALAVPSPAGKAKPPAKKAGKKAAKPTWVGGVTATVGGDRYYAKAKVGAVEVALGDVVEVAGEEEEEEVEVEAQLGMVQAMWQTASGTP